MTVLEKRKAQSRVKHDILGEYIRKWGFIITTGLTGAFHDAQRRGSHFRPRFVYVDYFSFTGVYAPEGGKPVYGSPVIGVKALDEIKHDAKEKKGFDCDTIAVLIEEDRATYNLLIETLEGLGYGDRIRKDGNIRALKDGDIAVIRGDCAQFVDPIISLCKQDKATFSFHFVDPYGPRSMALSTIKSIVTLPKGDAILNWVYDPIMRRMGYLAKEDIKPSDIKQLELVDAQFGSQEWRDIGHRHNRGEIDDATAERELMTLYEASLQGLDLGLTIKNIQLDFQERNQTLYYLFLTTHDPTGAFAINRILGNAEIKKYDYRRDHRLTKGEYKQTDMFSMGMTDSARPTEPEVDVDALSREVYALCQGRILLYRDVLRKMSKSSYYADDMEQALGHLKKNKLATFDCAPSKLKNPTTITFK